MYILFVVHHELQALKKHLVCGNDLGKRGRVLERKGLLHLVEDAQNFADVAEHAAIKLCQVLIGERRRIVRRRRLGPWMLI